MLHKLCLAPLFACIFGFMAWSQLALLSPPVSAASLSPSVTPIVTLAPAPVVTATRRAGVWRHYAAENPVVHALVVEGNSIWTATNGDGVVCWNRADGTLARYTTAAGLVNNTVRAIATDKNGHKWFGTENGVSEFDGLTWTTYTTTHGLIDNKVLGLAVDQANRKWFATWGGVSEFNGHTWTAYTRASGLPSNHVYAITIDVSGNKWIATPNGVAKFDGRQWVVYTTADGLVDNWVHAIAVDNQGRLWFGTPNGVSRFDGRHWRTYTTADGLVSNHVHAITVDNLGRVWLATPAGMSRFDGQTFQNYTPANGLPRNHITAIATDESGQPWLGTVDGVIGLEGHTWRSLSAGGLADNNVNAMAEDPTGHKWFATDNGVSVYDGRAWTTYATADGLTDNWVNDVAVDASGQMWFATQNGISTFDGRRWLTYTTASGLPGNEVKAIGRDDAGQLWFEIWPRDSSGSIASRFDGRGWTTITDTQNLPVVWEETSIAVDQAGRKWMALWMVLRRDGVRIIDGLETITQSIKNFPSVFTVAIDQAGQKWFGGPGGVTSFDDNTWTTYTTADGLPRNRVDQIMVDSANHKWFNTMSSGVVELDDAATSIIAQTPPPATPTLATLAVPISTPMSVPSSTSAIGTFPKLVAKIPLAPAGKTLRQMDLDQTTGHLYVRDDAGHLYIIDATNLTELAAFQIDGREIFILDAPNHRLYICPGYVYPGYSPGPVTVIDTTALTVTGVISPGGEITLDSARNQIYLNGQVYDGDTLQPVGQWPWQWGVYYNPLRDELIRDGLSALALDRQTQRLTRDLLPDFTAQACYDCGGTASVNGIELFPDQNLIAVESSINAPGHGGYSQPDRFFDATTLDELTDLTGVPVIERGCGSVSLSRPINGRIYREESRQSLDLNYFNLLAYGPDGKVETRWDGIDLGITNPNTAQMYLSNNGRLWVLNLPALSLAGTLPGECVLALDLSNGRIYTRRGGDLLIFSEQGGQPEPPPPGPTGPLPPGSIEAIKISPGYAADRTIFVNMGGQIYRSTDGGLSWAQLRVYDGSLEKIRFDFELSPNFDRDQTVFAGGGDTDSRGVGLYRSTDGGDTWQAIWNGLVHLRVNDIVISPNYSQDGTVLAYARYNHFPPPNEVGGSVFRSVNRGLNWTLVMTDSGYYTDLAAPEELLPPDSLPAMRFRPVKYGIQRTTDGGKTWQSVVISHQSGFSVLSIVPSPNIKQDQTVYLLSNEALYRSIDGGITWARDPTNTAKALAVSPRLKDGSHRLFLGSAAGEFWTLNPAEIKWQPVLSVFQWPTILMGEAINDIAAVHNGDVWVGTADNGIVRFTADATQTRYTLKDGLPDQQIGALAVTSDNTLWANTHHGGFVSFDGQNWTRHDFQNLFNGHIDFAVGPDGNIWFGGKGAARWNGNSWLRINDPANYTDIVMFDFAVGPDGTLWFATSGGVAWYKNGVWSNYALSEQYGVAVDSAGVAYFLGDGSIIQRYFKGEWMTLPPLKPDSSVNALTRGFYVAADGAVWRGTDEGVFRYDGKTWRQFTAQDGLPSNKVRVIAEDAKGQLWFGTDNGAAYVNPATLGLSPVVW